MPSHTQQMSALLDDIASYISDYVVVSPDQRDAAALWVLHTHMIEAASFTPYLLLTSPDMASGKSLMLDVLEQLCARPFRAEDVTVAVITHEIHDKNSTILLDEADNTLTRGGVFGASMRAVLNSGFRRGGGRRATMKGDFRTFGPKVIAMIGKPTGTLASRTIMIEMRRKLPDEKVMPFDWDTATERANAIKERIDALCDERMIAKLKAIRPERPGKLDDRQFDVWKPLLAIAQAAGMKWMRRATKAAESLFEERQASMVSVSEVTRLLLALQRIFNTLPKDTDRIKTVDLLRQLAEDETGPWADWWSLTRDTPMPGVARRLRTMLAPFGIESSTHRFTDGTVAKGYLLDQFRETFKRYAQVEEV